MKKFRYLYDEASDLRASEVGGESPEVLDLEFLQYAKNDISPLLNQLQAKQKESENKGMKGTVNGETKEVISHVNSARKEEAKTIFDVGVIVPLDKEAKSDSKVRITSDESDHIDANKVVDTNVTDVKTETNKKKVNRTDQKLAEMDKKIQHADKEVKEADKEVKEADREDKIADKEVKETDKEVKDADKEIKEADKEVKEADKEEKLADKEVKDWVESRRNCSAQIHVAFAKTHKTGGTTVQNILFRFGEQRRLSFVLPKEKDLSQKFAEIKRLPQKIRVDYSIRLMDRQLDNETRFHDWHLSFFPCHGANCSFQLL